MKGVELLAEPPWRTHSVTFPKPLSDSLTPWTPKHGPVALSCLMAELVSEIQWRFNGLGQMARDKLSD